MGNLNIEQEIIKGKSLSKNTKELHKLYSTYTAYSILLYKAQAEYNNEKNQHSFTAPRCYQSKIDDLFSLFKDSECLKGTVTSIKNSEDMLFLIDENTLLRLHYYDIINANINGLADISYYLLPINDCILKTYSKNIYCGDIYHCDDHCEERNVFGLFTDDLRNNPITPSYELTDALNKCDGIDIREILKTQSFDDIYEKINEAKVVQEKKLLLRKHMI